MKLTGVWMVSILLLVLFTVLTALVAFTTEPGSSMLVAVFGAAGIVCGIVSVILTLLLDAAYKKKGRYEVP